MLSFYMKKAISLITPRTVLNRKKRDLSLKFKECENYINRRVSYYCRFPDSCDIPKTKSVDYFTYKWKSRTTYYFDLKEYLRYFPKHLRFSYHFGDETHINDYPTLFKARPIQGENHHSVLFKLDSPRHFRFVDDPLSYTEKKDIAIFRGAVHNGQVHRIRFMEAMFEHPRVDAGQSNSSDQHPEWQKPFMSVEEQLQYKFLICLEGNDVASNLKWAMSSNSVVVTPKMKYETWFMEGTLKPGVHYIEVKDDWSDFDEKIEYYLANPEEAQKIVKNAHAYIQPFQNEELEKLVCIKTLERYFELSGQLDKKAD
ncbi:glycosyltransferase [Vibrio cholerae]